MLGCPTNLLRIKSYVGHPKSSAETCVLYNKRCMTVAVRPIRKFACVDPSQRRTIHVRRFGVTFLEFCPCAKFSVRNPKDLHPKRRRSRNRAPNRPKMAVPRRRPQTRVFFWQKLLTSRIHKLGM